MDVNQIARDKILANDFARNIAPFNGLDPVKTIYARAREIFIDYLYQSFVIPKGNNLSVPCGSPCEMKYFSVMSTKFS